MFTRDWIIYKMLLPRCGVDPSRTFCKNKMCCHFSASILLRYDKSYLMAWFNEREKLCRIIAALKKGQRLKMRISNIAIWAILMIAPQLPAGTDEITNAESESSAIDNSRIVYVEFVLSDAS